MMARYHPGSHRAGPIPPTTGRTHRMNPADVLSERRDREAFAFLSSHAGRHEFEPASVPEVG